MTFHDKVAIVTGGSQGIGIAHTSALLDIGMKVCICDIKDDPIEEFIKNLPDDKKDHVIFQKCDVSSLSDFKKVFERAISQFGRIDVVVNNAGIINEYDWKRMVEVNFIGVIHGIQLAFQYMDVNKGGHGGFVINTGSNKGFESFELGPVYSGCKHGVHGLTRSYGTDYHFEKTGVKVSAVCPGPVDTSLFHTFPEYCLDKETAEEFLKTITTIKPDAVAKALIKVLQEGKNGALLRVDENGLKYA